MSKIILATLMILSFNVLAADAESSSSTKVDNSKNPMTGTKKHKVTREAKKQNADGSEATSKTTDTTKTYSDGKTKTEHESESSNESH